MQQIITWSNGDPNLRQSMVTLGCNELIGYKGKLNQIGM